MALTAHDDAMLDRALGLARRAIGLSEPNPRVGCVMHDAQGQLAGEGFTQQVGGPHAEVMALRDAAASGRTLRGGTAWVSLEPCAHHGRTPPCADALVAAGLARVVVATLDPFAQVAGKGVALLRDAGVQVDVAEPGPVTAAAHALNIGFFSRVLRQRPWVRMKLAASIDGRTALPDGRSQWITSDAARADGQVWRHRAGAILTGRHTVALDDPRLDVRLGQSQHQPLRVIADSGFNTSPGARVIAPPGRCVVVGAQANDARMQALRQAGADVHLQPSACDDDVDLAALLPWLASHGVNELHVEAGPTLSGALWQAGLVDELLLYLAPKLLGPGRGLIDLPELASLDAAQTMQLVETTSVGPDLRLRLQPVAGTDFLRRLASLSGHPYRIEAVGATA
jgi:diaminohydroxyphosphoribosylaminopyrimidine deaminase/5-amino-6-(5-phosphoribosylamino)uracil reductase